MNISIPKVKEFQGTFHVPGDKSISHRALLIGAIAEGKTEITSCSQAADPLSTLSCIRQLGLDVKNSNVKILIQGQGIRGFKKSLEFLDAGNSGTTMRLLSGILVGQNFNSTLIGDHSLNCRPMKRVIEPLRLMGAKIEGTENYTAPLNIEAVDGLHAINYKLPVPSAQVKSSLLFAGLYADGKTTIMESVKTRDHTERMLGLRSFVSEGNNVIEMNPDIKVEGKNFFVPGDISAAAFIIAAGLIVPNSNLKIMNVGLNPTRRKILEIFRSMGGNIIIDNERVIEGEPIGDVIVSYSELKSNISITGSDVVLLIDEIPILSVVAMFAEGSFKIQDAQELRAKETDRISAIVHNIRLLGCEVEEYKDGFSFEGNNKYTGSMIPSYGDHRIAMAFGVAGFRIPGVTIEQAECVDISFPDFWKMIIK